MEETKHAKRKWKPPEEVEGDNREEPTRGRRFGSSLISWKTAGTAIKNDEEEQENAGREEQEPTKAPSGCSCRQRFMKREEAGHQGSGERSHPV